MSSSLEAKIVVLGAQGMSMSAQFPIYILVIGKFHQTVDFTNLNHNQGWERLRSWRDTVKTPSTPQRLQPSARRS
jgi:hypothetical protein